MSYDKWTEEFDNNEASLDEILEIACPNKSPKNSRKKLHDYYRDKLQGDYESVMQMYQDIVGTIALLKRLLSPNHDILKKCKHFYIGMLFDENDNNLMCMSVSCDKNFENQSHMYIFRSVRTQIKNIVEDIKPIPNISIILHSLCTYAIYSSFPNGNNIINVFSEPLPHMKSILSKYVKFNDKRSYGICAFSFNLSYTADEKFMMLWRTLSKH